MPFSAGVWTPPSLPGSWSPAISGQAATPSDWNTLLAAIAAGLSTMICKDGQSTVAANIPFAGFKLTGVGAGTLVTDAANVGQLVNGTGVYALDTGAADAHLIAPTPAISAYTVGQTFRWKVAAANLTTTPTLAVNGLTAGVIAWDNGALRAGDLPLNGLVEVIVASTTPTFHLQTPLLPVVATTTTTQAQADNSTKFASTAYVDRVAVQQVVSTYSGTYAATAGTGIPADNTIPQIGEGDQVLSLAITPKSATSKLVIDVSVVISRVNTDTVTLALFQDANNNAIAANPGSVVGANPFILTLRYQMTSGTTSSTTFTVRVGSNTPASLDFNGTAGAALMGGVIPSNITITEMGI